MRTVVFRSEERQVRDAHRLHHLSDTRQRQQRMMIARGSTVFAREPDSTQCSLLAVRCVTLAWH